MRKIKRVTSINQNGTKQFEVGFHGVHSIVDISLEFENSIHVQFDALDADGNIIGSFINGALSVDYFTD